MNAETAPIKYVFLDIVEFTKDRSVEAQADIIKVMNKVAHEALSSHSIPGEQLIVLPSGDGLCVALVDISKPFDIHLLLALGILERLDAYNSEINDATRRFQVRIGINENVDNLIIDFNEQRNVAGAGISIAQLIMNKANGGQILISQTVYETLRHREQYMNAFKPFTARGKHGQTFNVYQYIKQGHKGLNISTPSIFEQRKSIPPTLPKRIAYYFAHAIANRSLFLGKVSESMFDYVGVILLYFKACDSIEASQSTPYSRPTKITWGADKASIGQQYEYYKKSDFWTVCLFSHEITEKHLIEFNYCFEGTSFDLKYVFVNEKGKIKLKKEWPEIWQEFFGEQERTDIGDEG